MADDSSAMAAAPVPAAGSNELASLAKQFPAQMEDLPAKPAGQGPAEPVVRSDFADTAVWLPSVKVGPEGIADVKVKFPQSLTTWRIHGYGLTKVFQVGDAASSAITRKNLLVRLQSPRFFVERDEVVLSANVHNDLKEGQDVKVELILPDLLTGLEAGTGQRLTGMAHIPAGGKQRFDWPVKVLKAGMAEITVKAVGPAESDAMKLAFPVLVHGVNKTVAACGSYRPADQGRRTLTIELPEDIDPEQTEFSLALNPSLAGVMVEALPYLVGYPYGCVEQTMSRFYPTVLVQGCLKTLGTDLETVGKARAQLSPEDKEHRFAGRPGSQTSPVFSSTEVAAMIKAGLDRIYAFQHGDGGWGWWKEDDSSPYQTAYVLQGLLAARAAGVAVDGGTIERGMQFLTNSISKELAKPKDEQAIGDLQTQTYMAYLLSLEKQRIEGNKDIAAWLDELYARRGELTNYGRSLLAVALHQAGRAEPAAVCLRNVLQYVQRDDSNETAWVRTPQQCWWFWWNNDIETNAWALRAMAAIEPDNELGPRIVKWLLNNRRNGTYWRSTRDSAQSIAAMIEYMAATGETSPDYALKVEIDGRAVREVQVTKGNLFTFDNRVQLYGLQLRPGSHEVTITKTGNGSLYYGYQLGYFTKEEGVKGSGNEIAIKREYFRLEARNQAVTLDNPSTLATTPGNRPEPTSVGGRTENREIWERIPLADQEQVSSGQLIEVVLTITAKNTYDFLAFEDFKPAGCEPVELRSGGRWAGGLCPNVELRDEKVVFFIGLLDQGTHVLRYRMRAENPGRFHALPTNGFAMYAPEVRAISDEMRLGIVD